jgi:single-strand DNA-binding protein
VNDRRKGANGEWVDETTFVDVTLWGRTAEVASEYLTKGSPLLIEGRLKLDSWEAQDGQKRSKLKVVGERMQMLGGRGQGGPSGQGGQEGGVPRPAGARRPAQSNAYSQAAPSDESFDAPSMGEPSGGDDIPF